MKRFEGDWRYFNGEGGYSRSEPIGWRELEPVDQEFIDLITPKRKPKPKPPAVAALPSPAAPPPPAKPAKKAAPKKAPAPASNSASDAFDPL